MKKILSNQVHPTPPKKERVDAQGNARCRVFAKSGSATLGIAEGLTRPAADALIQSIADNTTRLGGKISCDFLVTPKKQHIMGVIVICLLIVIAIIASFIQGFNDGYDTGKQDVEQHMGMGAHNQSPKLFNVKFIKKWRNKNLRKEMSSVEN